MAITPRLASNRYTYYNIAAGWLLGIHFRRGHVRVRGSHIALDG